MTAWLIIGAGHIGNVWAAEAYGFGPSNYPSTVQYGEGAFFAPPHVDIHSAPSEDSPVVESLTWSPKHAGLDVFSKKHQTRYRSRDVFVSFYPQLQVAMLAVVNENDNGWAEVVYNQAKQLTGWVPLSTSSRLTASSSNNVTGPNHLGRFVPWQQFMKLNAKPYGVYWLNGVSSYDRSLRMAPKDDAKLLDVTVLRKLKIRHIKGNWLLVEGLDFDRTTPIGWVRWRDDQGNIMVFANFSGHSTPTIYTQMF